MKKTARRGFIYFRYALPLILAAVLVLLMLFPVYRFVTADTGVGDAISLCELLGNAFSDTREYIFGNGTALPTMDFSVTLFVLVIFSWVLFAVGVLTAVFAIYVMVKLCGGKEDSRARIWFVTLTANRGVLCIWQALMLPIFLIPKIMPLLYDGILNYHIELICEPFDMLFAALALYALTVAVIFVSKKYERLIELDVYKLPEKAPEAIEEVEPEESVEEESEDSYEAMLRRTRDEQTASILRLLNKDSDGENK